MVHPAELQGPVMGEGDAEHQARREVREKLGGFWHGQNVRIDLPKFKRIFAEGAERVLEALIHDRGTM